MYIRLYGDPDLHKKAKPVQEITEEIKKLSSEMLRIMEKSNGIGLAGPQVGVNKKIIVLNFDAKTYKVSNNITPGEAVLLPLMPLTLINPEILSYSNSLVSVEEGCVSAPGIYASVVRSEYIQLKATLLNGEMVNVECGNWLSIILQHEIDHLDGIVFIDKLTKFEFRKIKSKLNRLKKHNGK